MGLRPLYNKKAREGRKTMTTMLQAPPATSGTLLGIIVDVSSSMQKNWRNQESKHLPRFEAIRAILNEKILQEKDRLQADDEEHGEIDLFCLGMGFKTIMHTNDDDASFQKEHHIV